MVPFYFGFGLLILGYVVVYSGIFAIPLAGFIYFVLRINGPELGIEEKPKFDWLVYLLFWKGAFFISIVIIFAGMSGNAAHGVLVFGVDLFSGKVLEISGILTVVVFVAGNILVRVRHKQLRSKVTPSSEE